MLYHKIHKAQVSDPRAILALLLKVGTRISTFNFFMPFFFFIIATPVLLYGIFHKLSPYHTIPTFNDPLQEGLLKTSWEKWENAGNQHFLIFPQCFLLSDKQISICEPHLLVYSQFAQSCFAHSHGAQIFPSSPGLFSPIPASTFSHSVQYLSCPFAVSPNFIFAHFSCRPEAISPNFPILPNDHFALFPQGPFPFCPNPIFLISGRKTNKKFSSGVGRFCYSSESFPLAKKNVNQGKFRPILVHNG